MSNHKTPRLDQPYKRTTKKRPLAERFWEKVDKSGGPDSCWHWLGSQPQGYGRIRGEDRNLPQLVATHVSWEMVNGAIPPGMVVCHRCDNPPCVNPAHLFIGTMKDNTRDMVAKTRHCHGERYPHHKITDAQAEEIRKLKAEGVTYDALEKQFGISRAPLHRIVTGTSWGHAGGTIQATTQSRRRLSASEVESLRLKFATGTTNQTTLAAEFGVSVACVCLIVNGLSRASDPGPITKTRTFASRRSA